MRTLKGYLATPGGAEQHPDAAGYLTLTRKGAANGTMLPSSTRQRASGRP